MSSQIFRTFAGMMGSFNIVFVITMKNMEIIWGVLLHNQMMDIPKLFNQFGQSERCDKVIPAPSINFETSCLGHLITDSWAGALYYSSGPLEGPNILGC